LSGIDGTLSRRIGIVGARYALLVALACVLLLPLLWLVVSSFRPVGEIFANSHQFTWRTFVPARLTFENYLSLTESGFPRALLNSLFVAVSTMLLGVIVNSAAGFAFAVFEFPGRKLLLILVLASAMMPFEAIVIPLYQIIRWLGWVDSYRALILPEVANGLVIFLFRQFFVGVPKEFYEAARVDGASWPHIFWRIALPLSWPVVVTGALMQFITQWEAFFWPLVAAPSPDHTLVQIAITRNISFEETSWGRLFSSTTIACLVALIPFLAFQKLYLRNIASSGLK
jgi:ABC-type glycerol-3-phosphate transport system permease component